MKFSRARLNQGKLGLALFLMTFVIGCSESNEGAAPYQAPPLDQRDETPCYDPGVDSDAIKAIAENRVALAACRKKHQNVVDQYEDVRSNLGQKE